MQFGSAHRLVTGPILVTQYSPSSIAHVVLIQRNFWAFHQLGRIFTMPTNSSRFLIRRRQEFLYTITGRSLQITQSPQRLTSRAMLLVHDVVIHSLVEPRVSSRLTRTGCQVPSTQISLQRLNWAAEHTMPAKTLGTNVGQPSLSIIG